MIAKESNVYYTQYKNELYRKHLQQIHWNLFPLESIESAFFVASKIDPYFVQCGFFVPPIFYTLQFNTKYMHEILKYYVKLKIIHY